MQTFQLTLSLTCPSCRYPVPVNALRDRAHCGTCGETLALSAETWSGFFGSKVWPTLVRATPGTGTNAQVRGAFKAELTYGRRAAPACPHCATALPETLRAPTPCPGCGVQVAARRPNALVHAAVPGCVAVIGESTAHGEPTGAAPVLFACLACGVGLRVDGSARTLACAGCGVDNYLPDALWRRFFPVRKAQGFYVVCDLSPADTETIQASSDTWQIRHRIAQETQRPSVLARLARDPDSDVREAVASNPEVAADTQLVLARDADSDVRELLAANPRLTDDALSVLLDDSDSDVAEVLAVRGDLPLTALQALAAHDYWRVRQTIAKRPGLPLALAQVLARDSDSDVARHAKRHPEWVDDKPVEAALVKSGIDPGLIWFMAAVGAVIASGIGFAIWFE